MKNTVTIFTDGSSRGNPGPGGWGSVIVFDDGKIPTGTRVVELGGGEAHTTNNRMEISAALRALGRVLDESKKASVSSIHIHTDSSYLINGITKWVHGWQKKGWITSQKEEVQNRDLWESLVEVVDSLKKGGVKIEWKYVGGHVGIAGNERCDEIATAFADAMSSGKSETPKLYDGLLEKYSIQNILDIRADEGTSDERSKDKSRSRAKAYSYVSALDGKVMVHQTWAECEARVKGKSGTRFKKALSKDEEGEIVREFSKK